MTRALSLSAIFLLFSFSISTQAQDPATTERIQLLEQQLDQQRTMIQQQQDALEAMQSELDRLKADQEEAPVLAGTAAPEGSGEAVPVEPAVKNTSMEISGFVNLDMIYDFDRVAPIYESTLVPTTIPTRPDQYGTNGNFIVSIRQSRLAFTSEAVTPFGDASGWIEFDLFGTGSDAGDTTFNLRHAWAEIGRLGAGQTWSTFMDISTWPNVYDWWGPSGMALNRNPMLRYTVPLDDRGSHWAVALEKQNGSFNAGIFKEIAPGLADTLQPKSKAPDVVARWRTENDWGHFQAAGVARLLTVEAADNAELRGEQDEFGYGFNLTGIINVFDRDQVKYGLTWGEGIASFINDGGGSNLAPELVGTVAQATTMESWGYMLYYDHYWSDEWSTSIGLSQNFNDLTNLQLTDQPETVTYMSTNLFYSPSPQFVTGFEALYGKLETADGSSGSDFRIQFVTRYNFSHKF
jgi:hypothetical protein